MNVNGINTDYYYNTGIQKAIPSLFVPFNPVFDETIFPVSHAEDSPILNVEEIDEDRIKIIAHRGYSDVAPENTIPAFVAAAENGYDTVECDIEWTKDGVPVILHDSTINRTARTENGSRLIFSRKCSNLTYDELLKYDFGSWYSDDFKGTKIPTFDELLECANDNNLSLYIELKETANFDESKAQRLAEAVKEAGLEDKVTWISFNSDYLKAMAQVMPNSRLGYLTKKDVNQKTIEVLKSLQTGTNEVFLDLKSTKISDKSSKLLQEAGFDFEAWTVDSEDELKNLESYDCKGITTNKITEEDIADYYNP